MVNKVANSNLTKTEDKFQFNLSDPQHKTKEKSDHIREIIWLNVVILIYLHIVTLFAYKFYDSDLHYMYLFTFIYGCFGAHGTNAGTHELWSHRTYKTSFKEQLILLIAHSSVLQKSIFAWARDHRSHYRYSHTNADPCNPSRGFFFTHMGWLMCRKHPDVAKFGSKIDVSDLTSDRLLRYHHKFHFILTLLISLVIPTLICVFIFGAPLWIAFNVQIVKNVFIMHILWSIVSYVHFNGNKPPIRMQTAQWENTSQK